MTSRRSSGVWNCPRTFDVRQTPTSNRQVRPITLRTETSGSIRDDATRIGQYTTRASRSACCNARLFGTISPRPCTVMTCHVSGTARCLSSQAAMSCSANMPSPRLATVMPSCDVAMYRSCWAGVVMSARTRVARPPPRAASSSIAARGALMSANSAVTNRPLMMTNPATRTRRVGNGIRSGLRRVRADQRLEDVLDRDEPDRPIRGIAHDGLMRASLAQDAHDAIRRHVVRDAHHRSNEESQIRRTVRDVPADEILHAKRADDVLGCRAVDRE